MAKEILLYSGIYNFTAETFIKELEGANGNDVVLRINTPGGDPQAGFGMISKFKEFEGNKVVKVDGQASSMGAFFLAYADNVEALDVSEILIHRAAYPSFYESSNDFKGSADYDRLVKINKSLREGLEAKIDVDKFESITKKTLDEVFSMDSRIDVSLTAKQAKQINLINKVNKITPEMKAKIQSNSVAIAASFGVNVEELHEAKAEKIEDKKPVKNKDKMTIEKLKAEHPEVFAQAVQMGVSQEKNRVEAILVFSEIDMKACVELVESGNDINQKFTAEMQLKSMKASTAASTEEEGAEGVNQEPEGEENEDIEAKKLSDFEKAVDVEFKK